MSEQRLVSPLLDGFQVGDPISSHDGVRCCPAIKESTDNKYIVKILSIPASQSQLDALLLAGAYQDAASALEYFKDLADGVVKEIKLHQQLARLDGFVPCEMTRQAYAACKEPKELLLVEGADHGISFLVAKDRYVKTVVAFLKKYVEGIQ